MFCMRKSASVILMVLASGLNTGCTSTLAKPTVMSFPSTQEQEQAFSRAERLEAEGHYAEAKQIYFKLVLQSPSHAGYAHRLGVASTMSGDHSRAKTAFQRAIQLEPHNSELLADMGYAAYLRHDFQESERIFRQALSIQPDDSRILSNMALVLGFQGKDDECLALFRRVHQGDEAEVLCNLAYIKSQRHEKEAAAKLYEQALAINPQLKKASVALAHMQSKPQRKPTESVAKNTPQSNSQNQAPQLTQLKPENTSAAASPPSQLPASVIELAAGTEAKVLAKSPAPAKNIKAVALLEPKQVAREPAEEVRALTDWTDEEDQALSITEPAEIRAIPGDELEAVPLPLPELPPAPISVPTQTVRSEKNRNSSSEKTQTVRTNDQPLTIVQPAPEMQVEQDAEEQFFEAPATEIDLWVAKPISDQEPFGTEWIAKRLKQISERKGLTGMMGFCPVTLRDELKLVDALPQFTADYQTQKYQFGSAEAQQKFLDNPERYLPAAGGLDVVAVSQGTAVSTGSLEHALWFRHRLYLFLTRENLEAFRAQSRHFAVQ